MYLLMISTKYLQFCLFKLYNTTKTVFYYYLKYLYQDLIQFCHCIVLCNHLITTKSKCFFFTYLEFFAKTLKFAHAFKKISCMHIKCFIIQINE